MNLILAVMVSITISTTLTVKSPVFKSNDYIPAKYGCDQSNINPPLQIENLPANTKTVALIMDDPDAPKGTFVHWVVWNIKPNASIDEDKNPGTEGKNGKGENKYTGPCPPSGTHHYHFKVYALDTELNLPKSNDKEGLLKAMKDHIIGQGELVGLFKR